MARESAYSTCGAQVDVGRYRWALIHSTAKLALSIARNITTYRWPWIAMYIKNSIFKSLVPRSDAIWGLLLSPDISSFIVKVSATEQVYRGSREALGVCIIVLFLLLYIFWRVTLLCFLLVSRGTSLFIVKAGATYNQRSIISLVLRTHNRILILTIAIGASSMSLRSILFGDRHPCFWWTTSQARQKWTAKSRLQKYSKVPTVSIYMFTIALTFCQDYSSTSSFPPLRVLGSWRTWKCSASKLTSSSLTTYELLFSNRVQFPSCRYRYPA